MLRKFEAILENPNEVSTLKTYQIEDLLDEVKQRFELEQNLIELKSGQAIFVGDTHGDFQATKSVIQKYLRAENKVVFLGDYVDRGPDSAENINYLLALKLFYPNNLFLLMGNHEGRSVIEFYPADFWERLEPKLYDQYASILSKLPLVVTTPNGVIALHGALPDVRNLEDINEIKLGTELWRQTTWGDFREEEGKFLGDDMFTGRPQFGQGYFDKIMNRLERNVLIRSHQPDARQAMYDRRCLTIFTSSAYRKIVPQRTIAIANLDKEAKTIDDLIIEMV
jgi:predicted MPP superfamily phosphohydrolase